MPAYTIDNNALKPAAAAAKYFIQKCYEDTSSNKVADTTTYEQDYQALLNPSIKIYVNITGNTLTLQTSNNSQGSIEMTWLKGKSAKQALPNNAQAKSLFNYPNTFGLAYAECRNAPVVVSDFTHSYVFDSASTSYLLPNQFDSAYFCTTKQAEDAGYHTSPIDTSLEYKVGGGNFTVSGTGGIQQEKAAHDLGYYVEAYFVSNGYYPSTQDVTDNKLTGIPFSSLLDANNKTVNRGNITYTASPAGCTHCTGYTLSSHYYYAPTNNPISMDKIDFEHQKSN